MLVGFHTDRVYELLTFLDLQKGDCPWATRHPARLEEYIFGVLRPDFFHLHGTKFNEYWGFAPNMLRWITMTATSLRLFTVTY